MEALSVAWVAWDLEASPYAISARARGGYGSRLDTTWTRSVPSVRANSKPFRDFTGGKTVRQWLDSQSYEKQQAFGLKILQMVLEGKPLP